jgi:hypothetical protein
MLYRSIMFLTLGIGFAIVLSCLTGCASYVVPQPGAITLESAMYSVGVGLREMRRGEGDLRTGLLPEEVTVTFNISASGDQGGKLYVEVSPIPLGAVPIKGNAGGELSTSYTAQRGNQITIKFKNLLFSDPAKTQFRNSIETQKMFDLLSDPKNVNAGPFYLAPVTR